MTATGLVCVACGTQLPSDSKFCNKCGTPVGCNTTQPSTSR